jgi:hypothetical protein
VRKVVPSNAQLLKVSDFKERGDGCVMVCEEQVFAGE